MTPRANFRSAEVVADATSTRKLAYMRLTPVQKLFLEDDAPVVLMRGGNQIGKSLAIIMDMIHTARGTHPFQGTPKPPVSIVLLSESWDQMGKTGGFLEKLWGLLPKHELDPKIRFDPGRGITGKPPRIVFVSGPGKGSVISLGTYAQGAKKVAGTTVHRIYLDEPPPAALYQEIMLRVLRHSGKVRIDFTPVLDMPDQRWLRTLVEANEVSEHNPHLIEANCWPVGNPCPWLVQDQIDRMARSLPEAVRAMRLFGAWDPVLTKTWLTNFDRARHVNLSRPPMGAYLAVGIDHGTNAGKQAAVLMAVIDRQGLEPRVWFMDEYIGDGITSIAQDAQGIHDMIARNGTPGRPLDWREIDAWIGDRPTGESRYLVRKSNMQLRKHLARIAGVAHGVFPHISTPRKYHGSVEHGLWRINDVLGRFDDDGAPHCSVHPRAARFAEFCEKFAGDRVDPLKDVGDSARYALELAIRDIPVTHLIARY